MAIKAKVKFFTLYRVLSEVDLKGQFTQIELNLPQWYLNVLIELLAGVLGRLSWNYLKE